MIKHTPTPWQAKPFGDNAWVVMRGDMVLAVLSREDHPQWNEANAKFICRAANSHDALLEACKAWMKVESEMRDKHPCPDLTLRAMWRKEAVKLTEVAIALAKE